MNYIWILIIVLYIVLTHLVAQYIGTKRKIGYGKSVLISVLFSPIIGLICTLLSKKIKKQETTNLAWDK
jgi:Na+-driven multidrug efflux pump